MRAERAVRAAAVAKQAAGAEKAVPVAAAAAMAGVGQAAATAVAGTVAAATAVVMVAGTVAAATAVVMMVMVAAGLMVATMAAAIREPQRPVRRTGLSTGRSRKAKHVDARHWPSAGRCSLEVGWSAEHMDMGVRA